MTTHHTPTPLASAQRKLRKAIRDLEIAARETAFDNNPRSGRIRERIERHLGDVIVEAQAAVHELYRNPR